jgi:transcriptional regulator with XRE-family HTH domain
MEEIAALLKRARGARTQSEIADEIGCSQPLVSKWESGNGFPTLAKHEAVADAYGVSRRTLRSLLIRRLEAGGDS